MVEQSRIVDLNGNPITAQGLKTPQTAHAVALHAEFQGHPSRGLTPSKLASILIAAEQGDLAAQYELFEDMEEKDAHILSEMSKRRRAVTGLDYTIVPPKDPTAKERDNAEALAEILDSFDDFEEVLFDITDGIGKGFVCIELEWDKRGDYFIPKSFNQRPQAWFQLKRGFSQEIRLRGDRDGEELRPFIWIVHTHKAKSGYLERSALFRSLVWPYLFKNYSVGDLAEFLEIYGIPVRLGKYPSGATTAEKTTLMRALSQIGHNAAGIIPTGMELEFHHAANGDPKAFELMMTWCDKAQSKAILGGTLTSQADGATSTNALGSVHNEVRKELRDSDAKQVAKTVSRDLLYPIAALNGLVDSFDRCPRLRFDINEPEDMCAMAEALPKFVSLGYKIGRDWAQERCGIPVPDEDEDLLTNPNEVAKPRTEKTAALNRTIPQASPPEQMQTQAISGGGEATTEWINQVRELLTSAKSLEEFRDRLMEIYPGLSLDKFAYALSLANTAARMAGRVEVDREINNA